jgi:cation transport ATPase
LQSRKEQRQLEEKINVVMAQNSKLEAMVDKSSVEAVEKAQKEKESAMKKAEQEIADASFREKKARRDAKQEVERIKKTTQKKVRKAEDTATICFMAAFVSMILALARNEVLILDVISAVTMPFQLLTELIECLISPDETWFSRIAVIIMVLIAVVIVFLLIYWFIEEYRKQWNYFSVYILAITMAVLVTVGDMIRSVLPVNLVVLFVIVIVISTGIRKISLAMYRK